MKKLSMLGIVSGAAFGDGGPSPFNGHKWALRCHC